MPKDKWEVFKDRPNLGRGKAVMDGIKRNGPFLEDKTQGVPSLAPLKNASHILLRLKFEVDRALV
jgi:hypothetical protein